MWLNVCLQPHQSTKHILHQPADINTELVKTALNPEVLQWSWVIRNVRIRSVLALGSPAALVDCPWGLAVVEVNALKDAVTQLTTAQAPMPTGCTVTRGQASNTPNSELVIEKLQWSWSDIHLPDSEYDWVWRSLKTKFNWGGPETAGSAACVATESSIAPTPGRVGTPAPAQRGRPPTTPKSGAPKTSRAIKRGEPDPVVPAPASVRNVRHRKAVAKYEKCFEAEAKILVEQEERATVVRPHFVVARVKPFSKWPFGGVVVYAQFPFLWDCSWKKTTKWVAHCRKVIIKKTGGRYEVVFKPKTMPVTAPVQGPNGQEPLLDKSVSTATAAAASGVAPATTGAGAAAAAASGAAPATTGAGALVRSREMPVSTDDSEIVVTAAESNSRAGRMPSRPAADIGVGPASQGAMGTTGSAAESTFDETMSLLDPSGFAVADLFDDEEEEEAEYTALPDALQHDFTAALESGMPGGGPEEDEQIEWSMMTRSPSASFSLVCTFTSKMDLGRSQSFPCGTHRSDNIVTCAYPARDPRVEEALELE